MLTCRVVESAPVPRLAPVPATIPERGDGAGSQPPGENAARPETLARFADLADAVAREQSRA